jgi:hypothetical protein
MKLTRQQATMMFDKLGIMALGHLPEEMIEVVINNYNALGKVASDLRTLNEELHKRMYEGMSEADVNGMFRLIVSGRMAEAKVKYPELWPIFVKHNRLSEKLSTKEVEVEIEKVDADAFIKGILRGKKDAPIIEIKEVFAPMFEVRFDNECDMSELEEIMK